MDGFFYTMSTLQLRVYYEDTDAGGIVYHANYLKYFERARTELLRELGFEQDQLLEQDFAFVVGRLSIQYRQAAKFNDLLTVKTKVKQVRHVSLEFYQEIYNESGDTLAVVDVVVAAVNHVTMKPTSIPEDIYEAFVGES